MQTIWLLCANSKYVYAQAKIQLANNRREIKKEINASFNQNFAGNRYCLFKRAMQNLKIHSPNTIYLQKTN